MDELCEARVDWGVSVILWESISSVVILGCEVWCWLMGWMFPPREYSYISLYKPKYFGGKVYQLWKFIVGFHSQCNLSLAVVAM